MELMSNKWNRVYKDPLIRNLEVGVRGAMCYILDENGFPVSKGYHHFYLKHGTLMGQTGASSEVVVHT